MTLKNRFFNNFTCLGMVCNLLIAQCHLATTQINLWRDCLDQMVHSFKEVVLWDLVGLSPVPSCLEIRRWEKILFEQECSKMCYKVYERKMASYTASCKFGTCRVLSVCNLSTITSFKDLFVSQFCNNFYAKETSLLKISFWWFFYPPCLPS